MSMTSGFASLRVRIPPSPLDPGLSWKRRLATVALSFFPCFFLSLALTPFHELGHILGGWMTGHPAIAIRADTVLLMEPEEDARGLLLLNAGGTLMEILVLMLLSRLWEDADWVPWVHYHMFFVIPFQMANRLDAQGLYGAERDAYFFLIIGVPVIGAIIMNRRWRRRHGYGRKG
jgi:hypothetical protein